MPTFGNVVINDGQGTPVAHTFAPVNLIGNAANFADRVGGISVGYPTILISLTPPSKTSRLYKARLRIVVPTLETISNSTMSGIAPAPTKAYDSTVDMMFFMPERSTLSDRKNILAYAKNLLAHATVTSVIENNETVY